jgi:hypothetical protein
MKKEPAARIASADLKNASSSLMSELTDNRTTPTNNNNHNINYKKIEPSVGKSPDWHDRIISCAIQSSVGFPKGQTRR